METTARTSVAATWLRTGPASRSWPFCNSVNWTDPRKSHGSNDHWLNLSCDSKSPQTAHPLPSSVPHRFTSFLCPDRICPLPFPSLTCFLSVLTTCLFSCHDHFHLLWLAAFFPSDQAHPRTFQWVCPLLPCFFPCPDRSHPLASPSQPKSLLSEPPLSLLLHHLRCPIPSQSLSRRWVLTGPLLVSASWSVPSHASYHEDPFLSSPHRSRPRHCALAPASPAIVHPLTIVQFAQYPSSCYIVIKLLIVINSVSCSQLCWWGGAPRW